MGNQAATLLSGAEDTKNDCYESTWLQIFYFHAFVAALTTDTTSGI